MSMLRINQRIGNYRILRVIGEGGMGIVYEAEDLELQRRVAIKVMRDDIIKTPGARERFLREARAMAAIKSDHIVTIYQVGVENDLPFFVMELLEGRPLNDYLASGRRLTWKQVLRLAGDMAQGLCDAHNKGLIHRDIKPANIFIELPRGRVKILDFGLARPLEQATQLTKSGAVMGTPHYMAPEQAGGKKTDERADLFSLGVILYQMATGDLPFQGESVFQVLMAIGMHTPPPVRDICPDAPMAFSQLIDALLAKEKADRPASATEVLDHLDSIEDHETGFAPPSASRLRTDTEVNQKTPRPTRDRVAPTTGSGKWLLGLSFLVILVLAGVIVWMVNNQTKENPLLVQNPQPKAVEEVLKKDSLAVTETPPKKDERPIKEEPKKDIVLGFKPSEPEYIPPLIVEKPSNPPMKEPVKPVIPVKPEVTKIEISHSRFPSPPQVGDDVSNSIGMKFMWIPAGTFEMGTPGLKAEEDETPCKRRRITKAFWMSAFEVTQKEFEKVMGFNPSNKKGAELPVTNVSWDECQRFCERMKTKTGLAYRLPTEAEWEYACRAGSRSVYSFGNDEVKLNDYAWFTGNSKDQLHTVGQKRANAWGLYDMHGNVEEWCFDRYDEKFYSTSGIDDPVCTNEKLTERVRRGGSFSGPADDCRSAYRFSAEPKQSFDNLGFRVIFVK